MIIVEIRRHRAGSLYYGVIESAKQPDLYKIAQPESKMLTPPAWTQDTMQAVF